MPVSFDGDWARTGISRRVAAVTVRVPRRGTRGVPFPRFLAGLANRLMLRQFRGQRVGRTQGGLHAFVLETVGARSGKLRRAGLGYLEEGDDAWLVIASAGGAAFHPSWLHNLAARPEATIELEGGHRVPVTAESVEGSELEAAWTRIAADAPEYMKHRLQTDREIAVIRLRRRA